MRRLPQQRCRHSQQSSWRGCKLPSSVQALSLRVKMLLTTLQPPRERALQQVSKQPLEIIHKTPSAWTTIFQPGLFNLAASFTPKVMIKILYLKYVKMVEITVDDVAPQVPGCQAPCVRLPITDYLSEILTDGSDVLKISGESRGALCLP